MNNNNFIVYKPMLVAKAPNNLNEIFEKEKIIGTIKKDGYWSQLIKENNQVYLFSRSISKKTKFYSNNINKVPHLKEWATNNLPNGTCLIGEVYYPQKTSKDVTSILGALDEKAIKRQEDEYGYLHFYIHDILKWNGEDYVINKVDYSHRYSNLCLHVDIETPLIPEIEIAECYDNTYLNLQRIISQVIDNGEEGMVFRYENGLYLPGKRKANIMFKVKEQVDSLDFVILDLLDPEKEYTGKELKTWKYYKDDVPVTKDYYMGWKNALSVGAYKDGELVYVGRVASGLTDEMKAHMTKEPDLYIGSVCEIQAMSIDKERKTFRHPRLISMRFDKNPNECQLDEIFA